MKEKITVIIKEPQRPAKIKAVPIDSPLVARLRDAVPGEITADDIPGIPDVYGFSNIDNAKSPKPNVFYPFSRYADAPGLTAYGTMLYAAAPEREGELKSLSDDQIKRVTDYIAQNSVANEFEDIFHHVTNFKHYESSRKNVPTRAMLDDLERLNHLARSRESRSLYERAAAAFIPDPDILPQVLSSHSSSEIRTAARLIAVEKTQRKKPEGQSVAEPLRLKDFCSGVISTAAVQDPEYREFVANGGGSDIYNISEKETLDFVRRFSRFIMPNEVCVADADGQLVPYFHTEEKTPSVKAVKPKPKSTTSKPKQTKSTPPKEAPKKPITQPAPNTSPKKPAKSATVKKEPAIENKVKPLVQVTAFNDYKAWEAAHRDDLKAATFKAPPPKEGKGK